MGAIETIIVCIVFLVPGLLIRLLRTFFVPRKRTKVPRFEYLVEIVIDSIVVTICTALAISWDKAVGIIEGSLFTVLKGDEGVDALRYIVCMIVFSILWYAVKYLVVVQAAKKIRDFWLNKTNGYITTGYTVWEDYRQDGRLKDWAVVSVFSYDKCVTTGLVDNYSPLDSDEFAVALSLQEKMEKLKKENPKSFEIQDEYCDLATGTRIVWYKPKQIKELWIKEYGEDFTSLAEEPSVGRLFFPVAVLVAVLAVALVWVFLWSLS